MEDERTWTVEIAAVEGECAALPRERGYDVLLQGSHCPSVVMLDESASADWEYDPETQTTIVHIPQRDKRQETRITAFCQQPIVVLGEARNQTLIRTDLRRLLGNRYKERIKDTIPALDTVDSPGQATAIARAGGPLVRFVEFSTPEEATQQLGQVIVGSPADGTSYDLEASFWVQRGESSKEYAVEIADTCEAQILDTPFAAGKVAQTTQWGAKLVLRWQGKTLRYTHASQPLFPAITAWKALVYDRETSPINLDQVMDRDGKAWLTPNWVQYRQEISELRNLRQPHAVLFFHEHWEALNQERALAGYMATVVESPDEREVTLRFGSPGPATIYLNGQELQEVAVEEWEKDALSFRELRRTAPVKLRKGENWLLVDTRPPQEGRPFWFFGAAVTSPDGTEAMSDLIFR
jgi:hypothetical protein